MRALEQLMGAYFHQDWDIDGGRASDTVTAFVGEGRAMVGAAANEIDDLLAANFSEGALTARLESMGCQYYAGDTDEDYRRWLTEIRDQLRTFLATSAAS